MTERQASQASPVVDEAYLSGKGYVTCFAVLFGLTLLSFGCSYLNLGKAEVFVGLGIAALKVGIVALYFMRLIEEPPSHRLAALAALLFVSILVALTSADVLTRG